MNIKYLLALLNSTLYTYVVQQKMITNEQAFPQILMTDLENLRIPIIPIDQQQPFIALADKMLTLSGDLQQKVSRFLRRIRETYNLEKTTATLETFYTLSFSDFVKELGKQKVKLTLVQKGELEDYFNAYQAECQSLKTAIATTDREIDQMVYALYGLTDEEVKVMENQ